VTRTTETFRAYKYLGRDACRHIEVLKKYNFWNLFLKKNNIETYFYSVSYIYDPFYDLSIEFFKVINTFNEVNHNYKAIGCINH